MASYLFEASRFYSPAEKYSTGSGLSFFTENREHAESMFKTYHAGEGETFCVTVTQCDTGEVLMHRGPSKADTERSMRQAWSRRYREKSPA